MKKQKTDKSYKEVSCSISAITKKLKTITVKLEGKGVPDVVSTDGSSSQESGTYQRCTYMPEGFDNPATTNGCDYSCYW